MGRGLFLREGGGSTRACPLVPRTVPQPFYGSPAALHSGRAGHAPHTPPSPLGGRGRWLRAAPAPSHLRMRAAALPTAPGLLCKTGAAVVFSLSLPPSSPRRGKDGWGKRALTKARRGGIPQYQAGCEPGAAAVSLMQEEAMRRGGKWQSCRCC